MGQACQFGGRALDGAIMRRTGIGCRKVEGNNMFGPNLTIGNMSHGDPKILTVLVQDHIGGLQVQYGGEWVDVKPIPGALVTNVGDMLQVNSFS